MEFDFSKYKHFSVHSESTDVKVRCYAISAHEKEVKSLLLAGPEQQVVCAFSNMVQGASIIAWDGRQASKCDYRYRRMVSPIYPTSLRWISMLILSKDPRLIWQEHDAALIAGLKKRTETPFLDQWITYIRERLVQLKFLEKLKGVNAQGMILTCNTQDLDDIVTDGLRSGAIKMKG